MTAQTTWLQRWLPRPFDRVAAIFYLGTLAVHFYFRSCDWCDPNFFGWVGGILLCVAVALLFFLDRVEYERYGATPAQSIAAAFLVGRALLIVLISILDNFNFSMFLYLFIPYSAYPVFGSKVSYTLAVGAWAVYFYKIAQMSTWAEREHEVIFFIVYTAGLIFMVSMADVVSCEKASRTRAEKLLQDLELSHQQLQQSSTRVAALAATEERNRLARDIHDSLGHYLTVINIQLEKAIAFRSKKPDEAEEAVQEAKRLASEALHDIRRSVSTLRNPEERFSLKRSLTELVQDVTNGQLRVDLQLEGEENGFSRQSLVTLYRVAQEGLTNVQKHAQARHVTVQIHFDEQESRLTLWDDGRGFDVPTVLHKPQNGTIGYGLHGLQERVELVGGSLQVESRPQQGVRLCAAVPKNPLALVSEQ